MSAHWPYRCRKHDARAQVIARDVVDIQVVSKRIDVDENQVAPKRAIALPVAKKLAFVMTSSPAPTFSAISAATGIRTGSATDCFFVWQYAATSASRPRLPDPSQTAASRNAINGQTQLVLSVHTAPANQVVEPSCLKKFSRKGAKNAKKNHDQDLLCFLRLCVKPVLLSMQSLSCSLICVRVGLVVVGIVTRIVVVVARIDLHVVQHHAKHVRADVEQLLLGASHHGPRASPAMDHENHAIHHRRQDRRIGKRYRRR